jgi:hypothetical protein
VPDSLPVPADSLKLHVANVGQFARPAQLEAFFLESGIPCDRVEKAPHSRTALVSFKSAADRDAALTKISQLNWRGSKLFARLQFSNPARDTLKRKRAGSSDDDAAAAVADAPAAELKDVNDVVTPWRALPYSLQLSSKHGLMQEVLRVAALRLRAHVGALLDLPCACLAPHGSASLYLQVLRKSDLKWVAKHATKGTKRLQAEQDAVPSLQEPQDSTVGAETNAAAQSIPPSAGEPLEAPDPSLADVLSGVPADAEKRALFLANRTNLVRNIPPELAAQIPAWLVASVAGNDGMACSIRGILASPDIFGYRNKASFTIGLDSSGKVRACRETSCDLPAASSGNRRLPYFLWCSPALEVVSPVSQRAARSQVPRAPCTFRRRSSLSQKP